MDNNIIGKSPGAKLRPKFIKILAIVLMLLIANPASYLDALGHWSDPDAERPDDLGSGPIEVDEEGPDAEPEIEIDETQPVFARNLRRTDPFEKSDLSVRELAEGDEVIVDNGSYVLYFNEETLEVKVQRKRSGFIWSSAPAADDLGDLSGVWQAFVTAPVVIDYLEPGVPSATWRDFPELVEARPVEHGLDLQLEFPRAELEMVLSLRLLPDNRMQVEVRDESIIYDRESGSDYLITELYILPFFGAARDTETDGYLFVPDGPGALMRFNDARNYSNTYQKRVYGDDEGVNRPSIALTRVPQVEEPIVHMPVYGIAHGHQQEAFAAVIEEGSDYATILASPAGVRTNFYWQTAYFNYNTPFFQRTGRGGEGFRYVRRESNEVNPKISYYFLGDSRADYTGMALAYRNYLAERGWLPEAHEADKENVNLPLHIQAFMAEQERGLIFNRTRVMTHSDDIVEWMPRFHDLAGEELSIAFYGAQRGGISAHDLGTLGFARGVGGRRGWREIEELANELGVNLVAHTDLAVGNNPQMSRGDMVYNIDRSIAHRNTQNFLYNEMYFLDVDAQARLINELKGDKGFLEGVSLDLSSIGHTLLSDYEDGITTGRHVVRQQITAQMNSLSETEELFLESPNSYLWAASDAMYSVPGQHTQLLYQTDTVPFMQTVLSGLIPMFSRPMNFGAGGDADLLHMIDFNLYPAYLVTEVESSELRNANTQDIYYSQLDALFPEIESTYHRVNEILGPVRGAQVTGRSVPAADVSITDYSNGQSVIVNYTNESFDYEGVEVPAQSAAVTETAN